MERNNRGVGKQDVVKGREKSLCVYNMEKEKGNDLSLLFNSGLNNNNDYDNDNDNNNKNNNDNNDKAIFKF